jgi:hypothetical protein
MGIVLGYAILCAGGAIYAYLQGSLWLSIAGGAGSVLLLILAGHLTWEQTKARRFTAWLLEHEAAIYDGNRDTDASTMAGMMASMMVGTNRDTSSNWGTSKRTDTDAAGAGASLAIWKGIDIGPRSKLVQYQVVVSLGLWTQSFQSRLFLASTSQAGACRIGYMLLTLLLGWWALPLGPVRAVQAIMDNLRGGYRLTVHEWLEYGEPRPRIGGMTPLIQAVYDNEEDKVFELLATASQTIYERDEEGSTALLRAAEVGNLAVFDFLLAKGADLQDRDDYGDTVLIRAAAHGNAAVVQRILQFRIDPNITNNRGDTALIWAEVRDYPCIVRLLTAAGAKEQPARWGVDTLVSSGY